MERHLGRALESTELVHHLDHDETNNDLSNLQVMSRREHHMTHGMYYPGESNARSKITEDDVRLIRHLREEGKTLAWIGNRLGLSEASISLISRRKSWTHVK